MWLKTIHAGFFFLLFSTSLYYVHFKISRLKWCRAITIEMNVIKMETERKKKQLDSRRKKPKRNYIR